MKGHLLIREFFLILCMFSKRLKGKGVDINILESTDVYRGRPFGDWLGDWWNWLIAAEPEYAQTGPVYFLRPGLARETGSLNFRTSIDRRGPTSITVFSDQAILFPVLNTMIDARHFSYLDTPAKRRYAARSDNDDSPKLDADSFKIDLEQILDAASGKSWDNLRVESPDFKLQVPDVAFGKSLKDFLDYPLEYSGEYDAVDDGYWIFIRNLPVNASNYTIEWKSKGAAGYSVAASYEIKVENR